MDRLIASFFLAFLACLGAWGMFGVAIITDHWFESSVTEVSTRVGLLNICFNNVCQPHNFSSTLELTKCQISGAKYQFRFDGIRYALFAAGAFSVFAALLNLIAICLRATKLLYLGQFLMSLAFLAAALAVVYFYNSMEAWLYCDAAYCAWYESVMGPDRPCYYWYGFSFALASGGVTLFLLSVLWSGFTLVAAAQQANSQEDDDDDDSESDDERLIPVEEKRTEKATQQTQEKDTAAATANNDGTNDNNNRPPTYDDWNEEEQQGQEAGATEDQQYEEEQEGQDTGGTVNLEEDWREEEQPDGSMAWIPRGYYWDADSALYYSEESTHYYDPASNQYFDGDNWFE